MINLLGEKAGYTINSKGFKILNSNVGVLWGDGIDYQGIRNILFQLKLEGWSSENIVFGMGGGLLQKINRDNQRFAFKSSAQKRNGVWYDIFKKPRDISKMSKKGKLSLSFDSLNNQYHTGPLNEAIDILVPVFRNGNIVKKWTFDEVKNNAKLQY